MEGAIVDTGLGYPALLEVNGGMVAGEVYEVTDEVLAALDELEDYYGPGADNNEYERVRTQVQTDRGQIPAWIYVYRRTHAYPLISGGDWKLYRLRKEQELYYFAYGSCMDMERIERAGGAGWFQPVEGTALLPGFSLQFTLRMADGSRADIVEAGGAVEGVLYRIPEECLEGYLYQREGVEEGIYRPVVVPVQMDGSIVDAVCFVVADKEEEIAPPAHYMKEILRGARHKVSAEYYTRLAERFFKEFGYRPD
ncbi:gamma-glutamylcyclotransferase [Paenibacillus sp. HN-1]|nr:gamma-glutamylcyclotransferase [Paenibacillus sp. CGMCC 1.18879]MBY9087583.1 gamma-glutamylcyclotransferase [Paenibacillus sinensis]